MEEIRFDALTKAFGALTTRRLTLGALLGGALGRLGGGEAAAKQHTKKRKKTNGCKPACGPCQQCQKGKCRKTGSGKKKCKKSTCQPLTGTSCTPTTGGTGTCQAGSCVSGDGGGGA